MGLFKSKEEKLGTTVKSLLEKEYGFEFDYDVRSSGAAVVSTIITYERIHRILAMVYICKTFVKLEANLMTETRLDSIPDPAKTILAIMDDNDCVIGIDEDRGTIDLRMVSEIRNVDYVEKEPRVVLELVKTNIEKITELADDLHEFGL